MLLTNEFCAFMDRHNLRQEWDRIDDATQEYIYKQWQVVGEMVL